MNPQVTRFLFASVAVAAVAGAPPDALAVSIGVDTRYQDRVPQSSFINGAHFDDFRAELRAVGQLVPVGQFTPGELAGLDVLVLRQTHDAFQVYSPAQLQAIHAFVGSGGRLVVIGEGGTGTEFTTANLNVLTAPYGAQFSTSLAGGDGETIVGFVPHRLTEGVTTVGLDFYRPLSRVSPPAIDLTTGPIDILAVREGTGGAGHVVVLADASWLLDDGEGSDRPIGFGDNRRLLRNMLTFVVPEPGGWLGCLGIAAALAARRRGRKTSRRGEGSLAVDRETT